MAVIEKRGSAWRVRIRKAGINLSETFTTKAAALAWATKKEAEIIAGVRGDIPDKSVKDLIERYIKEEVVKKRGGREETFRLRRTVGLGVDRSGVERKPDPIASVLLRDLGADHIGEWRDRRLLQVSAASVRREWATLSAASVLLSGCQSACNFDQDSALNFDQVIEGYCGA